MQVVYVCMRLFRAKILWGSLCQYSMLCVLGLAVHVSKLHVLEQIFRACMVELVCACMKVLRASTLQYSKHQFNYALARHCTTTSYCCRSSALVLLSKIKNSCSRVYRNISYRIISYVHCKFQKESLTRNNLFETVDLIVNVRMSAP